MLFLNGAHWQSGDREIAVDAAVERLETEISSQALGKLKFDSTIDGLEIGGFAGILPKGNLHWAVDGAGRAGTGDVAHLDIAVDVAHKKISADVAYGNAAFVDGFDFDVNVARDLDLKIHFNDVAFEFAVAAPLVTMAAERAVDVELQQAFLFSDVEGNFFASLIELG